MNGQTVGMLPDTVAEELAKHGSFLSVTEGTSMRPLFRTHRDAVVIETPKAPIVRFDVVLYRGGKSYLLHRVIRKKDGVLFIRGDNTYTTEAVPEEEVIGVLSSFIRKGKRISVTNRGYRCYVRLWNAIYPLRFLYARVRHAAGKILRALSSHR